MLNWIIWNRTVHLILLVFKMRGNCPYNSYFIYIYIYIYIYILTGVSLYIYIYMYSYGSPHTAAQKQDDQHERTFSSYVRIQVVVLKTCLGRWTIGRSGERGSGISVLPARYDDDDYIYNHRRLLKIHYVIAIHLMRWLTNFYDFNFKGTAMAGIWIHPTKASLSQLVNFKNAILT